MKTVYLMQYVEGSLDESRRLMKEEILPMRLQSNGFNDESEEKIIKRIPYVEHMNDATSHFRRRPDGIYLEGEKTDYDDIAQCICGLDIPTNTFIAEDIGELTKQDAHDILSADKIVIINDTFDDEQTKVHRVLAGLYYLSYFISEDFSEEDIFNKLYISITLREVIDYMMAKEKFDAAIFLKPIWDNMKHDLESRNCAALEPKTRNIFNLRMESGLTRKDFAKYLSIPYRTVENWEKGVNKCPDYVYDLIEFRIDADDIFKHERTINNAEEIKTFLAFSTLMSECKIRDVYIFENENPLTVYAGTDEFGSISNFKPTHEYLHAMIDDVVKRSVASGDYNWNPETQEGRVLFRIRDEKTKSTLYVEIIGKNDDRLNAFTDKNPNKEPYIHLKLCGGAMSE